MRRGGETDNMSSALANICSGFFRIHTEHLVFVYFTMCIICPCKGIAAQQQEFIYMENPAGMNRSSFCRMLVQKISLNLYYVRQTTTYFISVEKCHLLGHYTPNKTSNTVTSQNLNLFSFFFCWCKFFSNFP